MNQLISPPEYSFDNHLHEVPSKVAEWESFINDLLETLKFEDDLSKKMQFIEYLGFANRVLKKLDHAEHYYKKALSISYLNSNNNKIIQNLIRLAHVYQWRRDFDKSYALFDQAYNLINTIDCFESLKASFHQHLGKFYFDQQAFRLALVEFNLALKMRLRSKAVSDIIRSSQQAIDITNQHLNKQHNPNFLIRRAEILDAESVHYAHMKSINEICVNDHNIDEIRVWGGRTYNPDFRIPAIKEQFYIVVEKYNLIEGFCQLKETYNDNEKTAHLYGLYITPDVLKQRLGEELLFTAFEYCKTHKIKVLTLKSSLTAFDFYKKYGFVQSGELSGIIRQGVKIRGYPMKKIFF